MPRPLPAIALLALVATGCTQTAREPEAQVAFDTSRQCFFTSQINGYSDAPDSPEGRERLIVHTGPNDRWLFEAFGPCTELDFSLAIALDTDRRTSICTGAMETLVIPRFGGGNAERCPVRLLGKVIEPEG